MRERVRHEYLETTRGRSLTSSRQNIPHAEERHSPRARNVMTSRQLYADISLCDESRVSSRANARLIREACSRKRRLHRGRMRTHLFGRGDSTINRMDAPAPCRRKTVCLIGLLVYLRTSVPQ